MTPHNRRGRKDQFERLVGSLQFFLTADVVENEERKREISDHLTGGGLVVLRNAFQPALAEKMFACLDQFSDWKVYEDYTGYFHYHHHNIYEDALYPDDLRWCRGIFGSDETKALMQGLTQRDCSGPVVFSASLYLPGDHSLPHNDFAGSHGAHRQVAFVWHLTKNWHSNWGGDLFWCRGNKYISPTFNSLMLFNVGRESYHHVTQVSPYATSKRLAISGWWTSVEPRKPYPEDQDDTAQQHPQVELV